MTEGSFFGELYLRSTVPLLAPERTAEEVRYLARAFATLTAGGTIVDLGCGHGRHAAPLNTAGPLQGRILGLELDALSVARRLPGFPAVRADLRALPLRSGSISGAYAWYSTLFVFSDPEHLSLLREIARALEPGGQLVIHTVPYERLAREPEASFRRELPDGSLLEEESRFDAGRGRDRGARRLTLPDGRVLAASYEVRYYPLGELVRLFEGAGLAVRWVHGGLQGEPLGSSSAELILGAGR